MSRDIPHRVSVDRVVSRNRQNPDAVRHDDVFPLSNDFKPGLFQSSYRRSLIHAGNLRHFSDRDFVSLDLDSESLFDLRLSGLILSNRMPDIVQRFVSGRALRVASRQIVTPNGKAFFGFHESDSVFHPCGLYFFSTRASTSEVGGRLTHMRQEKNRARRQMTPGPKEFSRAAQALRF